MTVLPQVEEAHDRRRRGGGAKGSVLSWGGVVALAAVCAAGAIAVVAVVVVGHGRRGASVDSRPVTSGQFSARVLLTLLREPKAYAAGGRLYVSQYFQAPSDSKLMAVNPLSGRVLATRRLPGEIDHMLLAGGSLYVTSTIARDITALARLSPRTLIGHPPGLLGRGPDDGDVGSMALAGGRLWVGLSEGIAPVAPRTGAPIRFIPIAGGDGVIVAADAGGRILLDSTGHENAYIERRDPRTGRVLATSARFQVATKPSLGGIADGGAWISWSGGMMGQAQRLDLRTLRPTRVPAALSNATNAIRAQVLDGILWVSQYQGGPQRNYCGDPATGARRASLPVPGSVMAAGGGYVYVTPWNVNPLTQSLIRVPIPRSCR